MSALHATAAIRASLCVALCLGLFACVSPEERELRQRQRGYNARLAQLRPGATRGDLRKLFPARAATRSFIAWGDPDFHFGTEHYRLDADFVTPVQFAYEHARPLDPFVPLARARASGKIGPGSIDALLFGMTLYEVRPRNTDTIISLPLEAHRSTIRARP
jgi:hypothetical protein